MVTMYGFNLELKKHKDHFFIWHNKKYERDVGSMIILAEMLWVEIPNDKKQPVYLSELFLHEKFVQNEKSHVSTWKRY